MPQQRWREWQPGHHPAGIAGHFLTMVLLEEGGSWACLEHGEELTERTRVGREPGACHLPVVSPGGWSMLSSSRASPPRPPPGVRLRSIQNPAPMEEPHPERLLSAPVERRTVVALLLSLLVSLLKTLRSLYCRHLQPPLHSRGAPARVTDSRSLWSLPGVFALALVAVAEVHGGDKAHRD